MGPCADGLKHSSTLSVCQVEKVTRNDVRIFHLNCNDTEYTTYQQLLKIASTLLSTLYYVLLHLPDCICNFLVLSGPQGKVD